VYLICNKLSDVVMVGLPRQNKFIRPQPEITMDPFSIRAKFAGDYTATECTYRLGIDARITERIAERFQDRNVFETCTGGGFTTIALARTAKRVMTVELEAEHQEQARKNLAKAQLLDRVHLIAGDCLSDAVLTRVGDVDAAFLDPDWALGGIGHVCRFRASNMRPPADLLLAKVLTLTAEIALILPPFIDLHELEGIPPHELQSIYLEREHALYCLYFGRLAKTFGKTELFV
jgi:hypothetical protein